MENDSLNTAVDSVGVAAVDSTAMPDSAAPEMVMPTPEQLGISIVSAKTTKTSKTTKSSKSAKNTKSSKTKH